MGTQPRISKYCGKCGAPMFVYVKNGHNLSYCTECKTPAKRK